MDYGYGRVSTKPSRHKGRPQRVENQVKRLLGEGIPRRRIFTDEYTGRRFDRPNWVKLLELVQPGDTVKVTKMTRLGRNAAGIAEAVLELTRRGVIVHTLDNGVIDPSTANGKLWMHILAAVAEWEADIIRDSTIEGLEAARERHGGQLPLRGPSIKPEVIDKARQLRDQGCTVAEITEETGISRASFYRMVGAR